MKTGTHDIISETSGVKVPPKRTCTPQVPIPFILMYEDYVLLNKENISKAIKEVMATYS